MKILSIRRGFASDHSSTSYEFLAVDKPLGKKERTEISRLSSRVSPTTRRAKFIYNVDGYDIPCGWESLMEKYYDVMYSESYGLWVLAIALNVTPEQFEELYSYEFGGVEEGMGIDISGNRQRAIITIYCSIEIGYARGEDYEDEDEDGDAIDDSGIVATDDDLLNTLTQVRKQIVNGDYRALYAIWEKYGDADDENPPPKPKSLETGSGVVNNFANMLGYIG